MTAQPLPFEAPESVSLVERLARCFQASPNKWIDGLALMQVAGSYAWRSRCSDLRREPFNLTIENRVRTVRGPAKTYRVSEYRLVVPSPAVVSGSGGEKACAEDVDICNGRAQNT